MSEPSQEISLCFAAAKNLAKEKLPYFYSGGHPGPGLAHGQTGYDCSGVVSDVLHHGGILYSSTALDTAELLSWGDSGEGQYMTIWVHDGPELQHTFIEFKIPSEPQYKWFMAAHTGTIIGWYQFMSTKGYTARRRK
jgi:hypothetical protein